MKAGRSIFAADDFDWVGAKRCIEAARATDAAIVSALKRDYSRGYLTLRAAGQSIPDAALHALDYACEPFRPSTAAKPSLLRTIR